MAKSFPSGMFDDKLQEVMNLLEERGEEAPDAEEIPTMKTKEEVIKELLDADEEEVLDKNQTAIVEYSMMMKQWEALMEDYERREAEEESAKKEAEGSVD
jgi:hypothetical protein